ncbi:hypothetical protein GCD22_02511 [Acidithiobacillus thiooxidans ATCC 19377]|uniref:Uncharacterized protein n=1 Tax=Acidithiobacillus thiooxidans ATCC 19377 TaxID=637390 RepID=A0A5P9XSU6_ACITH|nr:hypothetical protein GCD22_02511 [Acidithiobacillus thiooxidans ATCC 19377]
MWLIPCQLFSLGQQVDFLGGCFAAIARLSGRAFLGSIGYADFTSKAVCGTCAPS